MNSLALFHTAIGEPGLAVLKEMNDYRTYRSRRLTEVIESIKAANATQDALVGLPTKPCNRCSLPVMFKRNPSGGWWCFNPDGTPHFKLCGQI